MLIEISIGLATFAFTFVFFASLFEWMLHRYLMHKKFKILGWEFSYAFKAHAGVHHHVFKADETYHVQSRADEKLIPMAWWNGPVLVLIGSIPFALLSCLVGHWWPIVLGGVGGCAAYYGAYESMHWCMHKPLLKQRLVERFWFFSRLNGHHILHHRYMHKNFNVVLPVWDYLLKTLLTRSLIMFPQPAVGPSVPDVQPKISFGTQKP